MGSSINISHRTIKSCLSLIDSDQDGWIDFSDLCDFFSLFFVSQFNFRRKVLGVLNGRKFSHQSTGYLNQEEAYAFFNFLKEFYGIQEDQQDDSNVYFYKDVSYRSFVARVAVYFNDRLFINWA
jgi:hypothetical protein